ncbi:MAG: hypothetical protein OHK0045_02270 [Raineya sp.]
MWVGLFANAQSIQQGLQFMDMEQYSSAKEVFEKLLSSKPSGEHYYYLGYFHARNNNPDAQEAQNYFEKGLAADKKFPLNQIGLAEVMIMKGDLTGAKAKIEEVVKKTKSKNHDVLLRAGEALIAHKNKDANEAIRLLEMAVKLEKNATAATYIALGDAYSATEKPENGANAIKNYDFAISKSGDKSGKARTKRTEFMLKGKNPDYLYVLQQYKDILKSDASYTPTYRRIAELYQKGRNLDSAIRYNKLYMEKSERSDEVKYRNAVFLYKVQKYEEALSELKSLEGKVKYPEFNRWIGYAYQKNGDPQQAKAYMDKFLASGKDLVAEDYAILAEIAFANQNKEEAIKNLRKASDIETDKEESISYLKKVVEVFEKDTNYVEAAQTYDDIVAKTDVNNKKNLITNYVYAAYYWRLSKKDYDKADSYYLKALEADPSQVVIHAYRAESRISQNKNDATDKALAKPHYETFLAETDKLIAAASDKEKEMEKYRNRRASAASYLSSYYYGQKDLKKMHQYAQLVLDTKPTGANAAGQIQRAEEMLKLKAFPSSNTAPKKNTAKPKGK